MRYPTNIFQQILSLVIILLVPLVLILGAVRLVLNPWYLQFEYHTPNFPADEFGFTLQDRLRYSRLALDYLLNDAGISFLGDLRFPQGQQAPPVSCTEMTDCTRLYNDRELHHMVDVKNVVQAALKVWYVSVALILLLGVFAWRGGWMGSFRQGLSRGGWLTLILVGIIILFVLAAFEVFFVFFHDLFFAPGTWTFYTSDTLIRLFPERFWRDTFLMVGGLTLLFGILVGFFAKERAGKLI